MKTHWQYYLSRIVVVASISLIFAWSGMPWWMAGLVFIVAAGFFIWAPASGHYRVLTNEAATPLRLDERSRQIRDRAGRTAFVVVEILALAVFTFGQFQDPPVVPTAAIGIVLGLGMFTYLLLIQVYERAPQRE